MLLLNGSMAALIRCKASDLVYSVIDPKKGLANQALRFVGKHFVF
jgi:hypothetical protein